MSTPLHQIVLVHTTLDMFVCLCISLNVLGGVQNRWSTEQVEYRTGGVQNRWSTEQVAATHSYYIVPKRVSATFTGCVSPVPPTIIKLMYASTWVQCTLERVL